MCALLTKDTTILTINQMSVFDYSTTLAPNLAHFNLIDIRRFGCFNKFGYFFNLVTFSQSGNTGKELSQ